MSALAQLYRFASPDRRRQLRLVLALMLVGGVAEITTLGAIVPFLSLLSGQGVTRSVPVLSPLLQAIAPDPERQMLAATLLFAGAAVAAGAIRLQLAWSTQRLVLGFGHDLGVEIFRRTLLQPYTFHSERNSSQVIAAVEKVQILVFGVLIHLVQGIAALFISAFLIAGLLVIDPATAAVIAVAFAAFYTIVARVARKRLARNSEALGSAVHERVQVLQESVGAIRDVIIDRSQSLYVDSFRTLDRRLVDAQARTRFIAAAPKFIIEAAGMVVIAAVALALSSRPGGLSASLPMIGALALGAHRLLPIIQQLFHGWANVTGNASAIDDVLALVRLPVPDETEAANAEALSFREVLRFGEVSFAYPGRREPALSDISLSIPASARVGLIGPTGSGKSTFADLLMGLIEPGDGVIFVDGAPLSAANRAAWQRCIAHVPQTIFLADASIARNIAFAVPAGDLDMDRVRYAAQEAQLEPFIESLPDGFETKVGERGVRLSGGQRQRLGIARAIYKDAPVLVLDEPTSALDNETEAAVIAALDRLATSGRTVVIIAHRGALIDRCDMVVRLDNGRLAEIKSGADLHGRATDA